MLGSLDVSSSGQNVGDSGGPAALQRRRCVPLPQLSGIELLQQRDVVVPEQLCKAALHNLLSGQAAASARMYLRLRGEYPRASGYRFLRWANSRPMAQRHRPET